MSYPCERYHPMILEYTDGSLPSNLQGEVSDHLAGCASCRAFAGEMRTVSRSVAALPRKQTSANFDAALAMRLAEARRASEAKPAWLRAVEDIFAPMRSALRPGLALCSAAAALGFAAFLAPQAIKPIAPQHAAIAIDESAMLAQCVEQHRSETSPLPLDDWSAQNLSRQLDKAPADAAPGAVSLAEESNF